MDFGNLLSQFATADNQQRQAAENQLAGCMNENFSQFVMGMMEVLVNTSMEVSVRQMAGILFKRAISSLSRDMLYEKREAWGQLDDGIRMQVKNAMLQCLNDNLFPIRGAAASSLSAIARIEVPVNMWDSLFDQLGAIILDTSVSEQSKCSCLETLRYICEDLEPEELSETMANSVMMTILYSLQTTMPSSIRKEGIQTLNAALEFADGFMQAPEQCTRVMEGVLSCCQDMNSEVQYHAIICLNNVFDFFYEKLEPYIQTFYNVCKSKLEDMSNPEVAIQAALALDTLGVVELSIRRENPAAALAQGVGKQLVPILCTVMTEQDENDDGETMTVPIAAASCLATYCEVLGNIAVDIVWPFIESNINSANWHFQEAAIMTFGCILNGPDPAYVSSIVAQAVPMLVNIMFSNVCVAVRDSASWALYQICDGHLLSVPSDFTQQLLQAEIQALDSEPRVSQHAALSIAAMCDYIHQEEVADSNLVSGCYQTLLGKLADCSQRNGVANGNLRENAAFALISLIVCAARDCEPILVGFTDFIIQRFNECTTMASNPDLQDTAFNLQRFCCIVLVTLAQRIGPQLQSYVNTMIEISKYVLNSNNTATHTQGLLLYHTMVDVAPALALKELGNELPFILKGITTPEDIPTCRSSINLFGCILHTVGTNDQLSESDKVGFLQPIIDNLETIISSVMSALRSPDIPRTIKPNLMTCLSDIIWELTPYMLHHASSIVELAISALQSCNFEGSMDEEDSEWTNALVNSVIDVFDACTEITKTQADFLTPYYWNVIQGIGLLASWVYLDVSVVHNTLTLIQDFARTVKVDRPIREFVEVQQFLRRVSQYSPEMANEVHAVEEAISPGQYSSW